MHYHRHGGRSCRQSQLPLKSYNHQTRRGECLFTTAIQVECSHCKYVEDFTLLYVYTEYIYIYMSIYMCLLHTYLSKYNPLRLSLQG